MPTQLVKEEIKNSNWKLRTGRIIAAKQMTPAEKWFDIALDDGELDHEPGQFVQVEIFGVGEAPISVCSSPTLTNTATLHHASTSGHWSTLCHATM